MFPPGISFFLPDEKSNKNEKKHKEKPLLAELTQAFTNLSEVNWNIFWDLFLFRFLCESGFSAFFSTFGIVLMGHLGATQGEMAMVISLFSVIMIAMQLSMAKIKEKFYAEDGSGYQRNLHAFLGLCGAFSFLYLFSGYWSYIIVMAVMAVFKSILDTTWMEMLVDRTSESNKGTITGSFESMVQMASLVTPVLATYVGETYGYAQTYLIILLFLSLGVFIGNYCLQRNRQRAKSD